MSTRIPLIATIVVAAAAIGFEEYRIAGFKKLIATHQTRAREIGGELNRIKVDLEDAEKKRDSLETQTLELRKQIGALKARGSNSTDASLSAAPGKGSGGDKWMKNIAKMFTDPEMKKSMRTQQMLAIRMMYSDFAKELGYDAAQSEQLLEILADRQMDMATAGMAALDPENPNKASQNTRLEESGKRYEDQLKAMLGEAQFTKMQAYEATMGDRFMLQQFESQFTASGSPLKPEQKQQLIAVMHEERAKNPAQFNLGNTTNPAQQIEAIKDDASIEKLMTDQAEFQRRVLKRSRDLLDADQMAAFEKVQQQQLDLMKTQIKFSREFLGLGK